MVASRSEMDTEDGCFFGKRQLDTGANPRATVKSPIVWCLWNKFGLALVKRLNRAN